RHLIDDHDDLEQIDAAALLVELRLHLAMQAEGTLGGGEDRLLQRLDQHGSVDVLVFGDLVEDQAEGGTVVHEALRLLMGTLEGSPCPPATDSARPSRASSTRLNSRFQSGTRLAFWMSSMGRV